MGSGLGSLKCLTMERLKVTLTMLIVNSKKTAQLVEQLWHLFAVAWRGAGYQEDPEHQSPRPGNIALDRIGVGKWPYEHGARLSAREQMLQFPQGKRILPVIPAKAGIQ